MPDPPYLVLHTHLTADELRAHMQDRNALVAWVVGTLRARGFLLRSQTDFDGTLEARVDGTTQGLHVRQILPREAPTDDP